MRDRDGPRPRRAPARSARCAGSRAIAAAGPEDSLRLARGVFCELPSSRGGGGTAGRRRRGSRWTLFRAAGLRVGLAFSSATAAGFSRAVVSAPPALVRLGSAACRFVTAADGHRGIGRHDGLGAGVFATRRPRAPDPVELAGTGAASLPSVPSGGLASAPSPVTWKRTRPGMVMRLFTDSAEVGIATRATRRGIR